MGYLASDRARARFGLRFGRRRPIPDSMRQAVATVMDMPYVDLASSEFTFGLDRPVIFAAYGEVGNIQADHLPHTVVAIRVGEREVLLQLYDLESDTYVATMGASYQLASSINRYLSYSFLTLDWVGDGNSCSTPTGCLEVLYSDDGVQSIAGADLAGAELLVHMNRGYPSRAAKPRALNDLVDARSTSRMHELAADVMQSRLSRAIARTAQGGVAQARMTAEV